MSRGDFRGVWVRKESLSKKFQQVVKEIEELPEAHVDVRCVECLRRTGDGSIVVEKSGEFVFDRRLGEWNLDLLLRIQRL